MDGIGEDWDTDKGRNGNTDKSMIRDNKYFDRVLTDSSLFRSCVRVLFFGFVHSAKVTIKDTGSPKVEDDKQNTDPSA